MMTFSTPPWELHRATPETVLADIDPDQTRGWKCGKIDAEAFLARHGKLLRELQERLFADVQKRRLSTTMAPQTVEMAELNDK